MKNRRIAALALAILWLLPALCVFVFADSHISAFRRDPLQDRWYPDLPEGFRNIRLFYDPEDGISQKDFSEDRVQGVSLMLGFVTSDYFRQGMENVREDGSGEWAYYLKSWEEGGVAVDEATLEPIQWGIPVVRKQANDMFQKLGGEYYFTYSGERNAQNMNVKYSYRATLDCTVSNVVFEKDTVYMDIHGTESYEYSKEGDGWAPSNVSAEERQAWYDAYNAFREQVRVSVTADQTAHAISITHAPGKFYVNDSGQVVMEVSEGGLTLLFRVDGVMEGGSAPVAGVTQRAEQSPGEDGGVSVPAAIVIGVGGAGVAIAGAAAAAGGAGSGGADADDPRKRKSYKMYVQKDFADAIRRGAKPVKVRARMAEVDGTGAESDRNDLTAKITASGDGLTVTGAGMAGRYFEALVSAEENAPGSDGSVIFTFTGEGGAFTNTVVFRLIDGPSLAFVEETAPGTYSLYGENCGIDMIPGDGFTYAEPFMLVDATVEPPISAFSAEGVSGFNVRFEKGAGQFLYKLIVKNDTPAVEKKSVFDKVEESRFTISVAVEDEKKPLEGYVTVKLYPEGVTVASSMKGEKNGVKYVRVQSYEKEYYGDLDRPWQVSEMNLTFAVKGRDRALIDPNGLQYTFGKLKGGDGKGSAAAKEALVAEKYEYEESWGEWNGKFRYTFDPRTTLWEPTDGTFFIAALPVTATYDGKEYKEEIPLRLRGKELDPMEAWEKEYEKTRSRIERFCPENQRAVQLTKLEEIAQTDTCRISVTELRLMSKDILRAYMNYWTTQHANDQWYADALDWAVWGLDWVKWIGDCAFSIVVSAYTGPLEAIISPAKEVVVSALGEVGVNIVWGTEFNPDNLPIVEQLRTAGDNIVSGWTAEAVTDMMKSPGQIKMACAVIGGYFAYSVFTHYMATWAEGESDFYGAIMDSFKDMTTLAIKVAASALFKKWLTSENFQKKLGPKLKEFMQKRFRQHLQDQHLFNYEQLYNQSQELYGDLALQGTILDHTVEVTWEKICETFFTGLCGEGAAKVFEEVAEGDMRFMVSGAGEFIFRFRLWQFEGKKPIMADINISRVLTATTSSLFGWLYDLFFGGVPTAETVMEVPKDPPLLPAKN